MALNFLTPNTDFLQKTADSRRITKALVGDFVFDLFDDQHRCKVFLRRNMTKVLAYHDRSRTRAIETGTLGYPSARTRGPFLSDSVKSDKANVDGGLASGGVDHRKPSLIGNDASGRAKLDSAAPDIESMSQDCLKVKAQNGSSDEQSQEKRRSVRKQLARQHEDKNAQLYFDIVSIRKKLNFKETAADFDKRPRKRVRRETISCHCHVTIWDNRQGLDQKEPIIRKSELCEVSTADLGMVGFVADIKLQKPFVFKSSELHVPLSTPNGTVLGIGDQYFLEVKIIPTREDVDWPPVPVLGRSEGDQTTGLGRMAAETLQGSLVARYLHLPQAPASDVPLSVFYLHESRTYRSKYGLEVRAEWAKGHESEIMAKHEDDDTQLDLWKVDEEGRILGQKDSPHTKNDRKETHARSRRDQPPQHEPLIKVVFNIDAASAKGAKEFRKATNLGLCCPACPKQTFSTVEELQFHFMIMHSKYKFTIEKREENPSTNELMSITFKIASIGTTRPRNQDREPRPNEKDIDWQAPAEPFDVQVYVNGDQNWVDKNWVEGPPKKTEPTASAVTTIPDKLSTERQRQFGGFGPGQKGGFLPAEHVSPFRKANRKRYPPIKLRTMTTDKETMYTSISHRQVHLGEEARSESDDEMDDGWFVKKSLEALDIAAEKQSWTDEERLLRRKWNLVRLQEKLSHPRYLSDCLIRFVRAEKTWLTGGGNARKITFARFLDEFLQRRVINQEVTRDIWTLLHDGDQTRINEGTDKTSDTEMEIAPPTVPSESNQRLFRNLTPRQQRAEHLLRLSPYTCAVCTQPIEEVRRHGVHCSEHECEAPGVWYHSRCIRCKRKDKLNWKCELCAERLEEASKLKGNEVAVDYQ